MKGLLRAGVSLAAAVLCAACTLHQTGAPTLAGPSEFGVSVVVSSTPDSITQDGVSRSTILVIVRGPDSNPISGVSLHLDMEVAGVLQDFGTLSSRTIVTGVDGRASATFTAPAAPPPATAGSGTVVTIRVTPVGSNFQAAVSQSTDIRLLPPGVILPPAGTPTATFSVSPTTVNANSPVSFDASASLPGSNAQIVSFNWTFGDGSSGSGKTISHTFTASGTFNVTLTVTNDRGLASSTTEALAVAAGVAPTADFVFSPTTPVPLQDVFFDASGARPGTGHTIVSYSWNFGDGASSSGVSVTHNFSTAGTYNVILTVSDEAGQRTNATKPVTIASGTASGSILADFVFSPTNPTISKGTGQVFFDATSSSPGVSTWTWDFGDGSSGSGQKPSHTYTLPGTWVVRLTVTDAAGHSATNTKNLTVAP